MNQRLSYSVPDMECAGCAASIERAIRELDGVSEVSASIMAQKVTLHYAPDTIDAPQIESAIRNAGYTVGEKTGEEGETSFWRNPEKVRTALSGLFFALALAAWLGGAPHTPTPIWQGSFELPAALFLISALLGGLNFFPAGFRALRTLSLDMDFLMTIAIFGALAIGEHLEAAAIAFLFSTAELLEDYAIGRARNSLKALMELTPHRATVRRNGQEVSVPVEEVALNEQVLVRPGEKIPVDGKVTEGASAVDQSPITGESMPVSKAVGDEVFAGTINREGYLEIETTRGASESTLSRIIQIVEEAEERRAPSEQFVRRFARYYTPAVTLLALGVVLIPPFVFGAPFEAWFMRGLTLLVIACPCALIISTPVAVVSGITSAARNGILIKGGNDLEVLGEIRAVAFDKTGTLTHGRPEVTDILSLNGLPEREVLRIAAALEQRSQHPISGAVLKRAEGLDLPEVSDFESVTGRGVCARIGNLTYRMGKPDLFPMPAPEAVVRLGREGKTTVLLGTKTEWIGALAVADTVRQNSAETVRALRKNGIQRIVMLTGDNPTTAKAIAEELDVDEWQADLLPEEKVEAIERLGRTYGTVAMVGDGVNDAPALASASVGIAMGAAGTDTALKTADVALMADDLSRLPYLFQLSRASRNVIRQNVWASILLKLTLALGVFPGLVSLIVAVLVGDMGASLGVTGNALRLARVRP